MGERGGNGHRTRRQSCGRGRSAIGHCGEAIQSLSNSVSVSSQAASVIHTTSEQQFVGVDQVARAMVNIDVAMQQNLTGTSQLEAAAKELQELGEFLKEVVKRYKI